MVKYKIIVDTSNKKEQIFKEMLSYFISSLGTPWPTLSYYLGDSVTHPMLITEFRQVSTRRSLGSHKEVGSLNLTEHLVGFEPRTFLIICH